MRTFFDSSAFAKRYVEEAGSEKVEAICMNSTDIALSILCAPEIISALNRKVREKSLTRHQYQAAKDYLQGDLRDASIVNLTPAVVQESVRLLEAHHLRAADALQVACALEWKAERFVSSDERQLAAARKTGLKILAV